MKTRKGIKVPTARQLPSGNWFVQLRINGESIPITEPTEREAIAKAMAIKDGIIKHKKITNADRSLKEAIDLWIADNEHRLSPATVRGYVSCQKNGFPKLMLMACGRITEKVAAAAINEECKRYSAKTVVNRWGFIGQVLEWATGERISPMLPQVVTNPPEWEQAVSIESVKRRRSPSFRTRRSTTSSMVCFLFFSQEMVSVRS